MSWVWLAGAAWAQAIPNGSFDGGSLAGWTLETSTGQIDALHSGGDWVLRIERSNGNAIVCSSAFLVTTDRISAQMKDQPLTFNQMSWWLADPQTLAEGPSEDETPDNLGFTGHLFDASPSCGQQAVLCVEPLDDPLQFTEEIEVDDFVLKGDPCPQYVDGDGDGWCSDGQDVDGDGLCTADGEYATPDHDCDDLDPARSPTEPEICDGIDQDCDDVPDDGLQFDTYYPDLDGDGYGDGSASPIEACSQPAGYAPPGDCDDADPLANPAGADEPDDGIDQDCDGVDADLSDHAGSKNHDDVGCGCSTTDPEAHLHAEWLLVLLLATTRRGGTTARASG